MAERRKDNRRSEMALIIGLLLIVGGTYEFLKRVVPQLWPMEVPAWGHFAGVIWSITLVAVIIFLAVSARKGRIVSATGKPLVRSVDNRKIAGVCGGIAEFFDIDPMTVRIVAIVLLVVAFFMTLSLYLICWIAIPKDDGRISQTPRPGADRG